MLKQILESFDQISTMGTEARADARRRGISSFYSDPQRPGFIVEERPDGSEILISVDVNVVGIHAAE